MCISAPDNVCSIWPLMCTHSLRRLEARREWYPHGNVTVLCGLSVSHCLDCVMERNKFCVCFRVYVIPLFFLSFFFAAVCFVFVGFCSNEKNCQVVRSVPSYRDFCETRRFEHISLIGNETSLCSARNELHFVTFQATTSFSLSLCIRLALSSY